MTRWAISDAVEPPQPAWTKIPGFDFRLQKMRRGEMFKYILPDRGERPVGFEGGKYTFQVVAASNGSKTRTMLQLRQDLIFHAGDRMYVVPAKTIADGSSVSIARFWTGSGISRDLIFAGFLHDHQTRLWAKGDKRIPYLQRTEAGWRRQTERITLRGLAHIWGEAVESVSRRPSWEIGLFVQALAVVHPFHFFFTGGKEWTLTSRL